MSDPKCRDFDEICPAVLRLHALSRWAGHKPLLKHGLTQCMAGPKKSCNALPDQCLDRPWSVEGITCTWRNHEKSRLWMIVEDYAICKCGVWICHSQSTQSMITKNRISNMLCNHAVRAVRWRFDCSRPSKINSHECAGLGLPPSVVLHLCHRGGHVNIPMQNNEQIWKDQLPTWGTLVPGWLVWCCLLRVFIDSHCIYIIIIENVWQTALKTENEYVGCIMMYRMTYSIWFDRARLVLSFDSRQCDFWRWQAASISGHILSTKEHTKKKTLCT